MLRFFLFTGMIFALVSCAPGPKVGNATRQKWMGGAAGSGGGCNYSVMIMKKAATPVEVSRIWLTAVGERTKGKLLEGRVIPANGETNQIKGDYQGVGDDSVRISFAEVFGRTIRNPETGMPEREPEHFDPAPADLPAEFREGAVIWYKAGNKTGYWIIESFELLEAIHYP